MHDLDLFIKISRFAGERFDLTQAGGGNSSVKTDEGTMYIKASGFLLSEVSNDKGYAVVDNKQLLKVFDNHHLLQLIDKKEREKLSKELVDKTILTSYGRPSIETLLHSILDKYVLHTHPVVVNAITCRNNWNDLLRKLFPDCALVSYQTPGFELALDLQKELIRYKNEFNNSPKIIFLQNHGIIISSNVADDIFDLYGRVIKTISSFLNIQLDQYQVSNKISTLVNGITGGTAIAYLSEDKVLNDLLSAKRNLFSILPFCPDTYVFCGMHALVLNTEVDVASIINYEKKYKEYPKVIVFENKLFFIAPNLKKAREMEEVYKFHLLAADAANGNIQVLSHSELQYLGNWEAEKYRQKL